MLYKNKLGFTLLEMMIAIMILAVLTTLTAQSIQNAIKSKQKYQAQIEQESALRDAMNVIERDISLAFHHRDFQTEMLNQIDQEIYKANQPPQSANPANPTNPTNPVTPQAQLNPNIPPPPPPKPRVIPKELTAFVGDEKSLFFTSLSYIRTKRDQMASDQAKIAYYLKNCNSTLSSGKSYSSNCLWRRISPMIDDHIDKEDAMSTENVLLENIQEFKIKYFGPNYDEWIKEWRSNISEPKMKDLFPYAVEVYIKIEDPTSKKPKSYDLKSVIQIRFPNNPSKKSGTGTDTNSTDLQQNQANPNSPNANPSDQQNPQNPLNPWGIPQGR